MKTLKGWEESGLNLDKYMPEPSEIDEEMYLYILECVAPQYVSPEHGQGGSCEKTETNIDGEYIEFYMTVSFVNEKYFYLGVLPEFKQ